MATSDIADRDDRSEPVDSVLETDRLTKRFGELVAVDQVDLAIEAGEYRSIIGPNGAGKTTLFNLATGTVSPTDGRIRFRGEDITDLRPHQRVNRGIGRSFQITNVFGGLTVFEKPKVVAYTDGDLDVWKEVMARSLAAAGIEPGDMVQNAYGYGLFTGGLGFHDGIEELGAGVVPTGGGNTARQIEMLRDLGSDAIACTPSYCLFLAEQMEERGVDPYDLPVDTAVIGAEPFTDPMRDEIEADLDVTAIDVYGLSELIGPGVSIECEHAQEGLHIWEDHFYPEIVDPDTGEPLPEGESGELVLTSLTKEALPVIRYRTGDITSLNRDTCDCGRTCVRMDNVTGRTDDLLIVRGVNVYASQIEEAMVALDDVAPHYRIDLHRDGSLDAMEITVEHHEEYDGSHDDLEDTIRRRLEETLEVRPDDVTVVGPGGVERSEVGKVKRVFDHR